MRGLGVVLVVGCMLASHAKADKVHLVGGSVIEGKAARRGDKIIVEIESGELTLPADSVERIEASDSAVQLFEKRLAKLAPGDVKGFIALADFCRDHDMRDREQQMLRKVIDVAPDHAEARNRLGYVHTDAGWVTREEQLRAQGMVQRDGQWVTREQLVEMERLQAQADTAAHERDKAQAELEQQRVELEKARANRDAAQAQSDRAAMQPQPAAYGPYTIYEPYTTYAPYRTYAPYSRYAGAYGTSPCPGGRCTRPAAAPPPAHSSFPIAGVRDPFSYFH